MQDAATRVLKLLVRAPDASRARMQGLLEHIAAQVDVAGAELQMEAGKEHVALIVGCNQFLRFHYRGARAGRIGLWAPDEADALRGAGFTLHEPGGAVFRLFGWVEVEGMEGEEERLFKAAKAALERAL